MISTGTDKPDYMGLNDIGANQSSIRAYAIVSSDRKSQIQELVNEDYAFKNSYSTRNLFFI